jgi:hypothetical protein
MAPNRTTPKLCTCSQFIVNTVSDSQGNAISGKYLSAWNLAIHRSEEYKRPLEIKARNVHQSDTSPSESLEASEYLEESDVFLGFDENQNSFHLGGSLSIPFFQVALLNVSLINYTVFIILFVSWLHIFCNVSRQNCCTAVTALFKIFNKTVKQLQSSSI